VALDALAQRLDYEFHDATLLELALRHRSWCAEHSGTVSNERLEFLGDAVLGQAIADHVYRTFPALSEGELAKVRASVVSSTALASVARDLDLGLALFLGKGEQASGGANKSSILADALEAVFGAIYLDAGWEQARVIIVRLLEERVQLASIGPGGGDFKTRLQEVVARQFSTVPRYDVTGTGPDHAKQFEATVSVKGDLVGSGIGASKKEAEQAAARCAFDSIGAVVGD